MKLAMLQKPSLKRSREENDKDPAGHVEDIPTAEEARELGKTFETFELFECLLGRIFEWQNWHSSQV